MGTLNDDPNTNWLEVQLRSMDMKDSRRAFNACLLPSRDTSSDFKPLVFGKKTSEWAIDHLIPKKYIKEKLKGYEESDRLPNFAPCTQNLNNLFKTTPCSEKLQPGAFRTYQQIQNEHPHIKWLVNEHHAEFSTKTFVRDEDGTVSTHNQLNAQELLELIPDSVGERRIKYIASLISERI